MDSTDLSTLSSDDGLYKAATIYRQIVDRDTNDDKLKAVKKYVSKIEKLKSIDDIYKLFRDERYFVSNYLLRFSVEPDDGGYNSLYLRPTGLGDIYDTLIALLETDDNSEAFDGVLPRMKSLGYSKERIGEILNNSKKIEGYISNYLTDPAVEERYHFYNPRKKGIEGVPTEILAILNDLGAIDADGGFLAFSNCGEFLEAVFTEENVAAIRDHWLLSAILTFSTVTDFDRSTQMPEEFYTASAVQIIRSCAQDVLCEEYIARYIDDSTFEEIAALAEDVRKYAIETVYDTEWLSTHGQELARRKILKMRETVGRNMDTNDLSDLELADNAVDNLISLMVSKMHFMCSQVPKEDAERDIFDGNMADVNAWYIYRYNALYLSTGLLTEFQEKAGESFEEKMGHVGKILAHEISHAYGPEAISFDSNGWFEPWLTEDEQVAYAKEVQAIGDFFDGKEDEYGNKISGMQIANETYADIMAMKICLQLLSQKEDVDYDKFFRAAAREQAMYYSKDAYAGMSDEAKGYLPGKLRINYVYGQFDKFYETYDIDESSPFFVPEGKRIDLFK